MPGAISTDIRQIFESHHCYFEVTPYYVVTEERPLGGRTSVHRIHAGFDLDIYGVKMSRQPDPPAEYWLVYNQLNELVDAVRHENGKSCSVEVIPFGSTIVLDTRNRLQPMALLRIRVTHLGSLHEAAGGGRAEGGQSARGATHRIRSQHGPEPGVNWAALPMRAEVPARAPANARQ